MAIKPSLNQFNGGELSPQLEGRYDWDKYNYSAKLCKNFIPLIEGSLKRRGGSHFVASRRGDEDTSFAITISTEDIEPILEIDGEIVALTKTAPLSWSKEGLSYKEGTTITIRISAEGYVTQTQKIIIQPYQEDIRFILYKQTGENATIKFIAPSGCVVNINDIEQTSITTPIGTSIAYDIVFEDKNLTGNLKVTGDETYLVYLKNEELLLSNSQILVTSSPTSGNLYLPNCSIRYIGVGGGSGALLNYKESATNITGFGGGGGSGCEAILKIKEGLYYYESGYLSDSYEYEVVNGYSYAPDPGGNTYLYYGNENCITNKGGYITYFHNDTSKNIINQNFVSSLIWNKAGEESRIFTDGKKITRSSSVYKDYGIGSGEEQGTAGFLSLIFEGE